MWKQSLSELSGGQRSLLALSLILAMLLFKPAPIYILDEVPACFIEYAFYVQRRVVLFDALRKNLEGSLKPHVWLVLKENQETNFRALMYNAVTLTIDWVLGVARGEFGSCKQAIF